MSGPGHGQVLLPIRNATSYPSLFVDGVGLRVRGGISSIGLEGTGVKGPYLKSAPGPE
jgi:hypothetical protein